MAEEKKEEAEETEPAEEEKVEKKAPVQQNPTGTQRRRGETSGAHKTRQGTATRASVETAKKKTEDAHAPWKKAWEKETGKKYGIATAGEYNDWLTQKRKEREAAKPAKVSPSVSAQDAGDANATKDKK